MLSTFAPDGRQRSTDASSAPNFLKLLPRSNFGAMLCPDALGAGLLADPPHKMYIPPPPAGPSLRLCAPVVCGTVKSVNTKLVERR
eukprot:scaffold320979_cov33-Prasinocladus_malaysianus.AAC.1